MAIRLIVVLLCSFVCLVHKGECATKLIDLDFETQTWSEVKGFFSAGSDANMDNSTGIVDETTDFSSYPYMDCVQGAKCWRYQTKSGVIDDVLASVYPSRHTRGSAINTIEFIGDSTNLITDVTDELYVSWYSRFDNFNDFDNKPISKYYYLSHDNCDGVGAFYVGGEYRNTTYDNNCTHTCDGQAWSISHWGFLKTYHDSDVDFEADGMWHKHAIYINYINGYMQWYTDDILMKINESEAHCEADGIDCVNDRVYFRINGDPCQYDTNQFRGFQFVYSSENGSDSDNTEIASGWMVDDIEVWDGMPDDTTTRTSKPRSFNGTWR